MFTNLSFDELNALVKNERSMSFKKYFGEMNLPEEEVPLHPGAADLVL